MADTKTVLMCPPSYFDIEYQINPWMDLKNQPDKAQAAAQWRKLYDTYTQILGWNVQLIEAINGLPDMVFAASGGFLYKGKVALPNFRHPQRQPETQKFAEWFKTAGYKEIMQSKYDFEGEGDALLFNDIIFAGYPWRTDIAAHQELSEFFGLKVISLQLTDSRFYHLDTCLTIVDGQTVAIWPPALTADSVNKIREIVPNVIEASEQSALSFGLNAISDGQNIIISDTPIDLINEYKNRGLNIFTMPIEEFQKSGGGVKCLTLQIR